MSNEATPLPPRRVWMMVRLHRDEKLRLELLKLMWDLPDLNSTVKRLLDEKGSMAVLSSQLAVDSQLWEAIRANPQLAQALREKS